MSQAQSRMDFEHLRTEVEELENALTRIVDVLKDTQLTEGERIERALIIAEMARQADERW